MGRQKQTKAGTSTSKGRANLLPPWKPGQSGNPAGRPIAARQRLTDAFIKDLSEHYSRCGAEIITRVAEQDPVSYMNIVARFIPKETEITINGSVNLDPAQMQRIAEAWIVAQADVEALESDYVIEAQDEADEPALPDEPTILPTREVETAGEVRDGVDDDFTKPKKARRSGLERV